jgi:hypothetical protein
MALVEANGYQPNGVILANDARAHLRNARGPGRHDGDPVYTQGGAFTQPVEHAVGPRAALHDEPADVRGRRGGAAGSSGVVGDFSQAVLGIRKDISLSFSDQATIDVGGTLHHLWQQNKVGVAVGDARRVRRARPQPRVRRDHQRRLMAAQQKISRDGPGGHDRRDRRPGRRRGRQGRARHGVSTRPEAAITGAASPNSRTFTLVNKGQSGVGHDDHRDARDDGGVNAVAFDEKAVTLSGTAATSSWRPEDILAVGVDGGHGGGGLVDPGGSSRSRSARPTRTWRRASARSPRPRARRPTWQTARRRTRR